MRTFISLTLADLRGPGRFLGPGPARQEQRRQRRQREKKVKVYDFSGDTIEGDLIKPEGTTVDARDFAKHSSLIRIRKDFIAEILKSAEDL